MVKRFIKSLIGDAGANNAIDRDIWVKATLSRLSQGGRILDVGAGEQRYRSSCSHLSYVSQDFCEYDGKGNKEGLQPGTWDTSRIDITSDITTIPEPNASFDAILCTEVFEHIPDPIAAINEFHRLLRSGGELILSAPFCSLTHFAPYHYYSGFNRYFYEHYLPKIGFNITEISANGDYSEYAAQELRRVQTIYGKTPFYVRFCTAVILRFIGGNRRLTNTSDLGCFGYHIRAVKK